MTPSQLSRANLIILAIYILVCVIMVISTVTTNTDAAGRGMAWGFTVVAIGFTVVLGILNLIRARWFRIALFAVGLIPIALFILQTLKSL